MRIITWNCLGVWKNDQTGFQKKKDAVLELEPDVLVVPECEPLEKITFPENCMPTDQDRIGIDGQDRGLAVFCFGGFRLERLDCYDPDIKLFLPLRVFKGDLSLTLLAAWALKEPNDNNNSAYLDIVARGVNHYSPLFDREKMLFLGDFNTPGADNDLSAPKPNNRFLKRHLEIVEILSQKGIKSLFHEKNKIEHGKELKTDATLYHNSDLSKPFHCDYCFASADMMNCLKAVEIGNPEVWLPLSDHMPLIVDFDL